MAQNISTKAIENGTQKSWDAWLKFFEGINAQSLSHKEIAKKVTESGTTGWWSQMVTVAYEQHIGRRVPGQDCNGEYSVSATKTVDGTMDEALQKWVELTADQTEFSDIDITRGPDVNTTEKWRYWRCGLADGSRVNINIYQKAPTKVSLGVQHDKLESEEQVEHWRSYWKNFLKQV